MLKLIQWQWNEYRDFHGNKTNLLIHIIAVPALLLAQVALVYFLISHNYAAALMSLPVMALSFVVQGIGHKKEENPSIPFSSPLNAIARLMVEQWINFPRFVFSGGWWSAFKTAK